MHGQIKTHRLKNGAYVHYRYDSQGRGLLVDKWEPTWNATASEAIRRRITTITPLLGDKILDRSGQNHDGPAAELALQQSSLRHLRI